jgi:1-acyl-sn-glycerol-3-phosphate acyltransferase
MLRSLLTWAFVVLWSGIVGLPPLVLNLCTLGLLRRRIIAPVARAWARPIFAVAGVELVVRGAEHLRGWHPRVVVCNHTSFADAFVIAAIAPPGMVPLVKREIAWWPIIGQAFWGVGVAFVDRRRSREAWRTMERVGHWLQRGAYSAVLAPEGTRSRDGRVLPFKRGAFVLARAAGVPIVPVVLHGAREVMPRGSLRVRPGRIVVEIHPPRRLPADADPRRAAEALREDYVAWVEAGPSADTDGIGLPTGASSTGAE